MLNKLIPSFLQAVWWVLTLAVSLISFTSCGDDDKYDYQEFNITDIVNVVDVSSTTVTFKSQYLYDCFYGSDTYWDNAKVCISPSKSDIESFKLMFIKDSSTDENKSGLNVTCPYIDFFGTGDPSLKFTFSGLKPNTTYYYTLLQSSGVYKLLRTSTIESFTTK